MTNAFSSAEKLSCQSTRSRSAQQQSEINSNSRKQAISEATKQNLESKLQVVHATPGRVRLRTNDSSILPALSQHLRQQNGVGEVSTNQQTGSLVVNFDPNKLPLPQMLGLLQQFGVSGPESFLPQANKTDVFAAWRSPEFWKEQGLEIIPLIAGLAATGGLGIHGLPAIPVYMIAAGATRRAIDLTKGQESARDEGEQTVSETLSENKGLAAITKVEYSIVHAIPGRVRFNIPRLTRDRAYARRLQRLLKADSHITDIRLNQDAASIVLAYKLGVMPEAEMRSHWISLIQLADQVITPTELKTETNERSPVEKTSQPREAIAPTEPTMATQGQSFTQQTQPEAVNIWTDFKPPALSAALDYMAKFSV
jgi:hypothetical protein